MTFFRCALAMILMLPSQMSFLFLVDFFFVKTFARVSLHHRLISHTIFLVNISKCRRIINDTCNLILIKRHRANLSVVVSEQSLFTVVNWRDIFFFLFLFFAFTTAVNLKWKINEIELKHVRSRRATLSSSKKLKVAFIIIIITFWVDVDGNVRLVFISFLFSFDVFILLLLSLSSLLCTTCSMCAYWLCLFFS